MKSSRSLKVSPLLEDVYAYLPAFSNDQDVGEGTNVNVPLQVALLDWLCFVYTGN